MFHLFVVLVEDRDLFMNYLKDNAIETMIHYPIPPHQQKALNTHGSLKFPITEKIHQKIVSLPMSPVLETDDVSKIITIINAF